MCRGGEHETSHDKVLKWRDGLGADKLMKQIGNRHEWMAVGLKNAVTNHRADHVPYSFLTSLSGARPGGRSGGRFCSRSGR